MLTDIIKMTFSHHRLAIIEIFYKMCIELYVTYMYIVKNDTDVNKLAEIAFLGQ